MDFFSLKNQDLMNINDKYREVMYYLEGANSITIDIDIESDELSNKELKDFNNKISEQIRNVYNDLRVKGFGLL